MGTEIYWHGILDYDNRDNRKLSEVYRIWKRTEAISEMAGADYQAAFGLVRDYDNIWDSQLDVWHMRLAKKSEKEIFTAAQLNHTPMDMVYLLEDTDAEELLKYPVLFYPHPLILTEKRAEVLRTYVEAGGCLILGCRTGQKDETGKCVMQPMPGLLSSLTQTDVKEYTFVGPADEAVSMEWEGRQVETGLFNDILAAAGPDADILAKYSSNYYEGRPALAETLCGKGKVLHFGGTFTRDNVKAFLAYTGVLQPYQDLAEVSEACEIAMRVKDGKRYLFILNYDKKPQKVVLKEAVMDMDTKDEVQGSVLLKGYETKVYRIF